MSSEAQQTPARAGMEADEARWVETRLVADLLAGDWQSFRWTYLLLPTAAYALYGRADMIHWSLWVAAMLVIVTARTWAIRSALRMLPGADPLRHATILRRHQFILCMSGIGWSLSTWMAFKGPELVQELLCWFLLSGLGGYAVNGFSVHLRTMRIYLHALAVTCFAGLLYRGLVGAVSHGVVMEYWMLVLFVLYWQFLLQTGKRIHATYRGNLELQYRNLHLIDSLTHQSQAAQTAMEIKNRFLASAAHDIRQPVHALSLYAELLASEPQMAEEITPKIVKSTKAINALFESLFDLVQLDSGRLRVKVEPVDLPRLLHELELQYRPRAEARGLEFRLRVVEGEILSDPILLRRIVGNLLDNAVKYTDKGGILLAARLTNDRVRIEVHDTGIGIAPQYQEQVFQEFYKVPERQGSADGFGLGLAIVARLTSVLGHRLSMSSRPGTGTRFRLELQSLDTRDSDQRAARLDA